jgi:two-component sensor histidine kinase
MAEHLEIVWHEQAGPTVTQPMRRGFGLKLVEREVSYSLGGRSDVAFNPDGLEATIAFPLTEESSS